MALSIGIILLLVGGALLVGGYFYLSRHAGAAAAWASPWDAVDAARVAPDLAVLSLAGEPDERVIGAALQAGETDTAYAALAYSALLPDAVRGGHWILLGNALQQRDRALALRAYQSALDVAALSPATSDVRRSELSLDAARGFSQLGNADLARLALGQAESVAKDSLALMPAERRRLLLQVAAGYRQTGDAAAALALENGLDAASAGPGTREVGEPVLPSLRGSMVLPEPVVQAIAARQQAAAGLAAHWLSATTADREQMTKDLGQALEVEDGARQDLYASAGELSPADQLAMQYDRIAWLTVKYRVARGAYGASLVPAWASQAQAIRGELATAYTDLINAYGRQTDVLEPGVSVAGRVELLRQGLLWVRLGLFPDQAEPVLSDQLVEASQKLWDIRGSTGLRVVPHELGPVRMYVLTGPGTEVP